MGRAYDAERMEEIARSVWPGHADEVYVSKDGVSSGRGHLLIFIDHPRAPEAVSAALAVLNDDERVPLDTMQQARERIEQLQRTVDVLRHKYQVEKQKAEIMKARLLECAISWEEEAPHQAGFLKHLIAHEF